MRFIYNFFASSYYINVRKSLLATLLLSLMVILAACGDSNNDTDSSEGSSGSNDLSISATNFRGLRNI